ncbi:MAG: hypothetical protein SPE05_03205 [Bacteroidales bacterium]|nr:hypothetical protein [Bacteroidales bacterium]MDY4520366.1 hypothetical protein [Bacteroidales bacterium]
MKSSSLIVCASALAITLGSCSRTQTTANFDSAEATDAVVAAQDSLATEDLNKSKTILYTLPAPVEMASIIKQTGVKFNDQLLNDLSKSPKYTTNLKMGINLGIYATDMSVSGMFEQSQRMVDYLNAIKDLTKRLGIMKVLDEAAIEKLDKSDISKQEALDVISQVYMNTNQYLTENNRRNIATIVMAGGWTEGLFLALNLVDPNKLNKSVVERIVAQKLTMTTMLNILDSMDPEGMDSDLVYLKSKMLEVKSIFDLVELTKVGRVSAITDPDTKTTTITANIAGELNPDILVALKQKVSEIRAEFVE